MVRGYLNKEKTRAIYNNRNNNFYDIFYGRKRIINFKATTIDDLRRIIHPSVSALDPEDLKLKNMKNIESSKSTENYIMVGCKYVVVLEKITVFRIWFRKVVYGPAAGPGSVRVHAGPGPGTLTRTRKVGPREFFLFAGPDFLNNFFTFNI